MKGILSISRYITFASKSGREFTSGNSKDLWFIQKGMVIKMNETVTLCKIRPGQRALVAKLLSTGGMRRRLLDLGLINGTEVECVGRSPSGDPSAFLIRGAVIAIRSEDCRNILVRCN